MRKVTGYPHAIKNRYDEVSWKGSWLRLERDVWGFEFGNRTLSDTKSRV